MELLTLNVTYEIVGGDSVKAIRLLGETGQFVANMDLETFYQNSSLKEFQQLTCNPVDGKDESCDNPTTTGGPKVAPRIDFEDLNSALRVSGINNNEVVNAAPLSPIQEHLLGLGNKISILHYIYEVEGSDLKNTFEHAVELIESKNPIFRTAVVPTQTGFAQVLLANRVSPFLHAKDIQEYMEGLKKVEKLPGATPVQFCLVLNDKSYNKNFFITSVNHIFFDRFSRFLFEKDLVQALQSPTIYAAELERPWFGDFVNDLKASRTEEEVINFWKAYLHGAVLENLHPTPLDRSAELDGVFSDNIPTSDFGRHTHTSHTDIILAAWCLTLAKHTGLYDNAFAICRHGRSYGGEKSRSLLGPLVNITPMWLSLRNIEEPIDEFLHRVHADIFLTARWEQGHIPGVYANPEGNPWTQSIINFRPNLSVLEGAFESGDNYNNISRVIPRRDLQEPELESDWTIFLQIGQNQEGYSIDFYYKSSLVGVTEAASLMVNLTRSIKSIGLRDIVTVSDLLESLH